jgi:hypothetical protein
MRLGAAVALIATAALVFAASAGAAQIEVTAEVQRSIVRSLPPAGRSGNEETSVLVVRDRSSRAIGELRLGCRWVTNWLRLCTGRLTLPLGIITVVGASRTRYVGTMEVVGGSGRYRGARGKMMFALVGSDKYVLSINYTR